MKNLMLLASFLFVSFFTLPAFAECTPDVMWTAAWTDPDGQTTYSLQGPCKVYVSVPFTITATVTDSFFPNSIVGYGWSIKDNGVGVLGDGYSWLTLTNGRWQKVLKRVYNSPVDHQLQFKSTDLGVGTGSGWFVSNLIGTIKAEVPVVNNVAHVDAGPDTFIQSQNLNATVIHGTASDTDGGALTYRWLEGSVELLSSRAVGASGDAPLDLSTLPLLSKGDHTLTLEVKDGQSTVTDAMILSVQNSAPVAASSAGGTFNIGDDVRLAGSIADYDGDSISYRWLEGTTVLGTGEVATIKGGAPVSLPSAVVNGGFSLGSHTVTLEASDGIHTVTAESIVNVIDTVAPTLAPVSSASILWPPNGKMTDVTIAANVHDNSGGPVLLSVVVKSDQPLIKDRGGKHVPDWSVKKIDQASGLVVLQLRNSRSGNVGDRTYTVILTATDPSGCVSTAEVLIKAPHDKRRIDVPTGLSLHANGKSAAGLKQK